MLLVKDHKNSVQEVRGFVWNQLENTQRKQVPTGEKGWLLDYQIITEVCHNCYTCYNFVLLIEWNHSAALLTFCCDDLLTNTSLGIPSCEPLTLSSSPFIRLTAELSLFEVTGLASNRPAPTLLSSRKAATGAGTPLLCILFETNPLDESANQRLHVESQPLEIIYDAVSDVCRCACFESTKCTTGRLFKCLRVSV